MGETMQLKYNRHEHPNLPTDAERLLLRLTLIGNWPGDPHSLMLARWLLFCRTA